MPIQLTYDRPTILIRQASFERAGIARHDIDSKYNLTDEEFQVEGGLIAVTLPSDDLLPNLIDDFEGRGLVYFDDFFEMSGNWPEWLAVYVRGASRGEG
ncbi:MAG TPA: hypothetical protein VM166_11700 [Gemmatimonadaceae bacterium]|nr:hypothetical protein [Gemmatimonadaceae bacterium]